MRLLKLLVISAVILFLCITGISLLIPFHVRISRAVNVHASAQAIWYQVDDMHKWKNWNPFFSNLPSGKILYSDTTGLKTASMEIDGTYIHWKEKKEDERIALMQKKGFKTILNGWKCISHTGTDSTTVQWYMDFQLRWYPWEKFSSLLFEKSYGIRMEQGLNNLKKLVETDHTSIK